jgi:hypothetical protein
VPRKIHAAATRARRKIRAQPETPAQESNGKKNMVRIFWEILF